VAEGERGRIGIRQIRIDPKMALDTIQASLFNRFAPGLLAAYEAILEKQPLTTGVAGVMVTFQNRTIVGWSTFGIPEMVSAFDPLRMYFRRIATSERVVLQVSFACVPRGGPYEWHHHE
jgi:hypothetical protein